jgi:3-oxoacyl-[acyl-carrier protein] reductase
VIGCDLNEAGMQSLLVVAEKVGAAFYPVAMDITRLDDLDALEKLLTSLGHLDVMVHAAGVCSGTAIDAMTEAEWDRTFAVNLKAPFFLTQRLLPFLQQGQNPTIINISSMAGFIGGIKSSPAYSSSKAAMTCMTKNLAKYCAPMRIRVNEVSPGTTRTPMTENWLGEAELDAFVSMVPLGRLAEAGDIAKVILFLASDGAAFMTGQTIHVNGGMYIP